MTLRLRYIEIILWKIGPANNNSQRRTERKKRPTGRKGFFLTFLIEKVL
jgi:hypothetical protein